MNTMNDQRARASTASDYGVNMDGIEVARKGGEPCLVGLGIHATGDDMAHGKWLLTI
jgi:hypothetical protein